MIYVKFSNKGCCFGSVIIYKYVFITTNHNLIKGEKYTKIYKNYKTKGIHLMVKGFRMQEEAWMLHDLLYN